ncbi:MAG: CCA tRNA nucleotidyltransferase, partial [Flavobacteriaceae bacterium]
MQKAFSDPMFTAIGEIAEQMQTRAFAIGGCVRDALLQRNQSKDIDIVCEGSGIELAKAVADQLPNCGKVSIYKNYGTAMVRVGSYELEFVGARKESYKKSSRNPVVESGSLEDDQKRRDFTVNAMAFALNPKEFGTLIDPFDGLEDLDKKVLKTPLTAAQTFSDDPLRMLRAVRFAAQLDFTIDPSTMKSIRIMAERIEILSQERIVEEIHKILLTRKPSKGFLLLDKLGLLQHIFPELCSLKGIEEVEGQRHKDNFYHTFEVVDNICQTTEKLWLR